MSAASQDQRQVEREILTRGLEEMEKGNNAFGEAMAELSLELAALGGEHCDRIPSPESSTEEKAQEGSDISLSNIDASEASVHCMTMEGSFSLDDEHRSCDPHSAKASLGDWRLSKVALDLSQAVAKTLQALGVKNHRMVCVFSSLVLVGLRQEAATTLRMVEQIMLLHAMEKTRAAKLCPGYREKRLNELLRPLPRNQIVYVNINYPAGMDEEVWTEFKDNLRYLRRLAALGTDILKAQGRIPLNLHDTAQKWTCPINGKTAALEEKRACLEEKRNKPCGRGNLARPGQWSQFIAIGTTLATYLTGGEGCVVGIVAPSTQPWDGGMRIMGLMAVCTMLVWWWWRQSGLDISITTREPTYIGAPPPRTRVYFSHQRPFHALRHAESVPATTTPATGRRPSRSVPLFGAGFSSDTEGDGPKENTGESHPPSQIAPGGKLAQAWEKLTANRDNSINSGSGSYSSRDGESVGSDWGNKHGEVLGPIRTRQRRKEQDARRAAVSSSSCRSCSPGQTHGTDDAAQQRQRQNAVTGTTRGSRDNSPTRSTSDISATTNQPQARKRLNTNQDPDSGEQYRCREHGCGKSFNATAKLRKHLETKHPKTATEERYTDYDAVRCELCLSKNRIFFGEKSLKYHKGSAHPTSRAPRPTSEVRARRQRERLDPQAEAIRRQGGQQEAADVLYAKGRWSSVRRIKGKGLNEFREVIISLVNTAASAMESGDEAARAEATLALLHAPCLLDVNHEGDASQSKNHIWADILLLPAEERPRDVVRRLYGRLASKRNKPRTAQNEEKRRGKVLTQVERLVKEGDISRATKKLESLLDSDNAGGLSTSEETVKKLEDLHPGASGGDRIYAPKGQQVKSIHVTVEEVKKGIESCPRLSGGALTPWTFDLFQQLNEGGNDLFARHVTRMFNQLLQGHGGDPTLWLTSRIIPLKKPDGGVRPIAVGEVWVRLLGRITARKEKHVGLALAPLQYGVAFQGGAEVIIHACGMFARWVQARMSGVHAIPRELDDPDDPWVLVAVDLRNAFNTVKRAAVFKGVMERCPELIPYFLWMYGAPSDLRFDSGRKVCQSATGVRQGDPLGSLLFCLAIHDVLRRLKIAVPKANAMFYIDDGTIIGPRSAVLQAVAFLKKEFAELGLDINMSLKKTTGWDATREEGNEDWGGFSWTTEGVKILGTAVGGMAESICGATPSFVRAYVERGMEDKIRIIPLLKELDLNTAMIILKSAINARPNFMLRAALPSLTEQAAVCFDTRVDNFTSTLCNWGGELPWWSKVLRGSAHHGQLRRMDDVREAAYLSSWSRAAWEISENHNWLWRMCVDANIFREETRMLEETVIFAGFSPRGVHIKTGEMSGLAGEGMHPQTLLELPAAMQSAARRKATRNVKHLADYKKVTESAEPHDEREGEHSDESVHCPEKAVRRGEEDEWEHWPATLLSQSALMKVKDAASMAALLSALVQAGHQPLAAWIRSMDFTGSTPSLKNDGKAKKAFQGLSERDFVEKLRLCLGLFPLGKEDYDGVQCGGCLQRLTVGIDDFHALVCRGSGCFESRHDCLRDALQKNVDRMVKPDGGSALIEQNVGTTAKPKKADVLLSIGGQQRWIDLEVRSCCGSKALQAGSYKKDGVANSHTEVRKRSDWKGVASEQTLEECFVVAAIEDGGRMGNELCEFMDQVSGLDKVRVVANSKLAALRKSGHQEMQTIIDRFNATMVIRFRANTARPAGERGIVFRNFTPPVGWKKKDFVSNEQTMKRKEDEQERESGEGDAENRSRTTTKRRTLETFAANMSEDGETQKEAGVKAQPTRGEDANLDEEAYSTFIAIDGIAFGRHLRQMGKGAVERDDSGTAEKCHCVSGCEAVDTQTGKAMCRNARGNKECDSATCNRRECNNRRLQMGRVAKTRVAEHPTHARKGVQAAEPITTGGIVGEFFGLLTPENEVKDTEATSFAAICKFVNCRMKPGGEADTPSVLDARRVGNEMRFLTPVCAPNCELKIWWVHGMPRCLVIACKSIKEEDFLTVAHTDLFMDRRKCEWCRPENGSLAGALIAYTDGSKRRHKDAAAGWGVVVVERPPHGHAEQWNKNAGTVIEEMWGQVAILRNSNYYLGAQLNTSNTGEFTALCETLLWFRSYSDRTYLTIYTDSEMVLKIGRGD